MLVQLSPPLQLLLYRAPQALRSSVCVVVCMQVHVYYSEPLNRVHIGDNTTSAVVPAVRSQRFKMH